MNMTRAQVKACLTRQKPRKKKRKPMVPDYAWQRSMREDTPSSAWVWWYFPRTVISVNARENWVVRSARAKRERDHAKLESITMIRWRKIKLPVRVTFTRYSAGMADSDGLPTAMKGLRDGIADAFGVTDAAGSGIDWSYAQEKVKRGRWAVKVTIEAIALPSCPGCSGGNDNLTHSYGTKEHGLGPKGKSK